MTKQLYLTLYMMFATPTIELLSLINLLLCRSSCVLSVVLIMWEKSKENTGLKASKELQLL